MSLKKYLKDHRLHLLLGLLAEGVVEAVLWLFASPVAAGMVIEGLANGIRIPEDIAILGVDDQPLASCIQIPLTTIRQPIAQEGEYAAKEMIRQLRDGAEDTIRKELDLELVIRQSA